MSGTLPATSDIAFEILVRRHHRTLLAYATTILDDEHDARDVVQDAFLVAYRRLGDFDPARSFAAWMRGIVRNCCHENRRRSERLSSASPEVLHAVEQQYQRWARVDGEEEKCALAVLSSCLGRLPESLRQVVELFYMENLSGREVARLT